MRSRQMPDAGRRALSTMTTVAAEVVDLTIFFCLGVFLTMMVLSIK